MTLPNAVLLSPVLIPVKFVWLKTLKTRREIEIYNARRIGGERQPTLELKSFHQSLFGYQSRINVLIANDNSGCRSCDAKNLLAA